MDKTEEILDLFKEAGTPPPGALRISRLYGGAGVASMDLEDGTFYNLVDPVECDRDPDVLSEWALYHNNHNCVWPGRVIETRLEAFRAFEKAAGTTVFLDRPDLWNYLLERFQTSSS